jgi:hypothetical protein
MRTRTLADRRAFVAERGATDPILIIAGIAITLILIVGGTFAVSGFIGNAQNTNAKSDLDRVATAEAAALGSQDSFLPLAVGPAIHPEQIDHSLAESSLGFVPSEGASIVVRTSPSGWAAVVESASGSHFLRTSSSSATVEVDLDRVDDYVMPALDGTILATGASATNVGGDTTVRYPEGINEELMAERWVEATTNRLRPALRHDFVLTQANGGAADPRNRKGYSAPFFPADGSNYVIDEIHWQVWGSATDMEACGTITVTGTGANAQLRMVVDSGGDATLYKPMTFAGPLSVSPDYSITDWEMVTYSGFNRPAAVITGPGLAPGETRDFRVCAADMQRLTDNNNNPSVSHTVTFDPTSTPTSRRATITVTTTSQVPICPLAAGVDLAPLFNGYTGSQSAVTVETAGARLERFTGGAYTGFHHYVYTPCTGDKLIRNGETVDILVSLN